MRVIQWTFPCHSQRGLYRIAGFLGAIALLLTACQGDQTGPGAPDATPDQSLRQLTSAARTFTLAPGAATAARTAKLGIVRTLHTTTATQATLQAATRTINSPFDLTYAGGPVVPSATSWNLYINCADPATCWGTGSLTPGTLLADLNKSSFIRVANQYIFSNAMGAFPVAELGATISLPHKTSILDILGIVFSAVAFTGADGYDNIYHVFLPAGTDTCLDLGLTFCYSPDDPSTFGFCAYHASVDFSPTSHVLFSVEPYQAVVAGNSPGCILPSDIPHGVIDATASSLSHEFFEVISDPDGNAWFNQLFGLEMGDECFAFRTDQRLNQHLYFIQTEYSNKVHACTSKG